MWPTHILQSAFWRTPQYFLSDSIVAGVGVYSIVGRTLTLDLTPFVPVTKIPLLQIEEAVYQILKANTNVTSLVAGRIFSGKFPQTLSYPAICYRAPADNRRRHTRALDGSLALITDWIDILCASKVNYGEASKLDEIVALALEDYSGTFIDETDANKTIDIQRIIPAELAHSFINDERTEVKQFITRFECTYLQSLQINP